MSEKPSDAEEIESLETIHTLNVKWNPTSLRGCLTPLVNGMQKERSRGVGAQ